MHLILIMSAVIALSYWLEEHTRWATHISGVMLIIIIAALLANSGVIPATVENYEWEFKWMMPLGVILMLLAFNPQNLLKIKKEFIWCFVIGALATSLGGIIAGLVFKKLLPLDYWRISGQLTASFIGGYENAVSVGASLQASNEIFLKTMAGDSIFTSLWMMLNIFRGRRLALGSNSELDSEPSLMQDNFANPMNLSSVAITVSIALAVMLASYYLHDHWQRIPAILWASLLATVLTFTPFRERFQGAYVFGSFVLSCFIFACGAISNIDLSLFKNILLIYPLIILLVHFLILLAGAKIFKIPQEIVLITSQSLIGGPASALAVASASKLEYHFEAITLGLLGYAVGNYFGFGVAWLLK